MININTSFRHRYLVPTAIGVVIAISITAVTTTAYRYVHSFIIGCGNFIAINWTNHGPLVSSVSLGIVVLAIGVVRALFFIVREQHRQRTFAQWIRLRETRIPRDRDYVNDDIVVVRADSPVALTHGILHPRIILSTSLSNMLSADERSVGIQHDRVPVERQDPARRIMWEVVRNIFFCIPIVTDLAAAAVAHHEIIADEQTISNKHANYHHLTTSVKKLLRFELILPRAHIAAFDTTAARLRWLAHPTNRITFSFQAKRLLITLGLILGTLGLTLSGVHAAQQATTTAAASCAALENRALQPAQYLEDVMSSSNFIRINFSPAP